MATITKGAAGLVLTTAANWVGGVAPGAADVARWISTSSSGNHTGSLTILGLQIDGAVGDVAHTSGTLTLTQTDAFINGTSNNRRWTQNGGVMALGTADRTFTLVHTGGGYCIDLAQNGALTGSGTLSIVNGLANGDYFSAYFGASFGLTGFTGTVRFTDGTGLFSGAASTGCFTAANLIIDGPNCILSVGVNGAGIGGAGKTLTLNDNVTLGRSGYNMVLNPNIVMGSAQRTLTVPGTVTANVTVTGTGGIVLAGASKYIFLTLPGNTSGLSGPCGVTGGSLQFASTNRYIPSTLAVSADARFIYSNGSADYDFPVTPTGAGIVQIRGNFAGNGVTFPATGTGSASAFDGYLSAMSIAASGLQTSKIVTHHLPGGFEFVANASNTTPAISSIITYVGSGQTRATSIVVDSENNTQVATLNNGTFSLLSSGSGPIVLSGTVQRTNSTAGGAPTTSGRMNLTLGGTNTGDNTLSGAISEVGTNSAILGITKVDASRWVLSGNNTHTGVHTISAGTLAANSATALGSATSTGGVSISGTGVLELGDGVTLNKSVTDFTLSNATNPVQTAGTSTLQSKQVTLSVTPTFTVPSGRKLTIAPQGAGIIVGSGTGITKAGDGELELTATANTFNGAVTVSAGTLTVGSVANTSSAAAWGTGAASSTVAVSGVLKYNGAAGSSSRAVQMTGSAPALDASGSGALTLSNVTQDTTAKTMTLRGTSTDANTISSAIANNTGAVSLAKEDAGRWVLSGALSYTGTTAVNAGTLRVATANSNTTSGTVTIGASGTVELVTDTLASSGATSGEVLGTGNVSVSGVVKTRGGTTQKGQVRYGGNLTFGAGSTLYIGAAA